MFTELAKKLSALLITTEDHEREAYLASSVDLVDLEHRINVAETHADPVRWYAGSTPHDGRM
ncbi:DUF3563 family protein [Paraburkholderia phytofirmans]|uniref:DUF3563 domain-containing protein n=1 Tax=Paraburkholderia phytofirmans (strain DSM 17436 / LMG 22146 / PsJN) TaxID=398527 RepID=B2TDT1_PARPJ|nr:DUF3563 family protein [Paraburkholderia phytofirmans]ACD19121.1 hypothetical protein Bphyt_4756 [Paraburkholderia phytofirmans PsJN]